MDGGTCDGGTLAIREFLIQHVCNHVCRSLLLDTDPEEMGLPVPKAARAYYILHSRLKTANLWSTHIKDGPISHGYLSLRLP